MSTSTETALERGIAYLAERQLPHGGFSLRYGFDVASEDTVADDHTIFGPALVAWSLGYCGPAAKPVLDRAIAYLYARMEPGGVWRHWSLPEPRHHLAGPDVDDTSVVSQVLRAHGFPVPDNRALLLSNRDDEGRFWTWIYVRWPPPRNVRYWIIALKRLRHPLIARALWKTTPAIPRDLDGIVNADVLWHLGDGPHAAPVVAWLIDIFRAGDEDRCDKWYRGTPTFCWAVARAARTGGVRGLDAIREEACDRLCGLAQPDGSIGEGALDTALALSALAEWEHDPPEAERACAYLEATQSADGSWPAAGMYYADLRDEPTPHWGSAELTT